MLILVSARDRMVSPACSQALASAWDQPLAVHPSARFGEMVVEGDRITAFEEKPAVANGYINGGFMVVSKAFISKYLNLNEDLFFEREPMRGAARDGQMTVYRHEGFWQCMDTPREYQLLNDLWASGNAPWAKRW